jgi:hypothetical protein
VCCCGSFCVLFWFFCAVCVLGGVGKGLGGGRTHAQTHGLLTTHAGGECRHTVVDVPQGTRARRKRPIQTQFLSHCTTPSHRTDMFFLLHPTPPHTGTAAASSARCGGGSCRTTTRPDYGSSTRGGTTRWWGLCTLSTRYSASTHQLTAASVVHVTNLTPPGRDNPRRAYGQ